MKRLYNQGIKPILDFTQAYHFMEMKNKFIFGASGQGKVVADCITNSAGIVLAFFDDAPKCAEWNGISILKSSLMPDASSNEIIIAIGNNQIRKQISERLSGSTFGNCQHKTSLIASNVSIGIGTVILANTVINSDTIIGKHCIVNTSSVVEHDCRLGDFVHLSPKAAIAGNVSIGEGTHIGIGALVIPNIKIGKWCTIGAGTVVIRDVPDHAVVVGNPGKIIRYNTSEND